MADSRAQRIVDRINAETIMKRPTVGGPPVPGAYDPGVRKNSPIVFQPRPDSLTINVNPGPLQVFLEPTFRNSTTEYLYNVRALIDRLLSERPDGKR